MDTRRDFIKKAAWLSGGAAAFQVLPMSIQRALAIDPAAGSTFMDADHIVLLMQENRSFDHAFGTLRGVRGFNDPRAITLPGGNKVWLQKDKAGNTFAPSRLDIKDTTATWLGCLPHSRESQVEARNQGKHDNWIEAKRTGSPIPLTMGHYVREDIPFYYALADAFTICDQHFCSSLTGTDPNRLFFWSGTLREGATEDARAFLQNGDVEAGVEWTTFPERLEQQGISWKVYQNDMSGFGTLQEEADQWLGNFGDNSMEYFRQFNMKLSPLYIAQLPVTIARLQGELGKLKTAASILASGTPEFAHAQKNIQAKQEELTAAVHEQQVYTTERYAALSPHDKKIHERAFTINTADPFQRQTTSLSYMDGATARDINVPKGDVFHQFREDVRNGSLPTVSWLVAPEYFSDHPDAPWFGSWYVSEAMDILTSDPAVWKKTIFILTYDENDGYFDHVPPFVAPDPLDPSTGKASPGIDTGVEQVRQASDSPGPVGLGYRVPFVVASPWSRGGWVNSQVFDHTSSLRFLETFLQKKFGKPIKESNISQWRRTVSGDLTSVFRPYNGEKMEALPFLGRDPHIEHIYNAKFKPPPAGFQPLNTTQIAGINAHASRSPDMPGQEKGIKPATALPYELYVDGGWSDDRRTFRIAFRAGDNVFGHQAAGAPFNVYHYQGDGGQVSFSSFAVNAGDTVTGEWPVTVFGNGLYHFCVHGPNGFFREFKGSINDPHSAPYCVYEHSTPNRLTGNIEVLIASPSAPVTATISDHAYGAATVTKTIGASTERIAIDLSHSHHWYDVSLKIKGDDHYERRYAGHVETGHASFTDPLMGGLT